MKPVLVRFTLQTSTTATDMAPTITFRSDYISREDYSKEYMNLNHKIRKPIVEKLRRDRINNSIEELKALLGPQLLNQQPDSKLEKADILEMTVCLLRQQLKHKTMLFSDAAGQGSSVVAQEGYQPFRNDVMKTQSHVAVLSHIQSPEPCFGEVMKNPTSPLQCMEKSPAKNALWRPW
ncbi:hypothetical protein ACEWY4_013562 [Coilia grayii]|uniref:BHLH domain-containing protein n=1 Tax=Coilia grayii TaxID=363190 RepID=A0ABD1JWP2_9TELE